MLDTNRALSARRKRKRLSTIQERRNLAEMGLELPDTETVIKLVSFCSFSTLGLTSWICEQTPVDYLVL